MPLKTEDRDMGEKRIRSEMSKLDRSYATIGVHDDAGDYPDGQTIAQVAAYNEFGTKRIPSRPFLRSAVEENLEKLREINLKAFQDVTDGTTDAFGALDRMGMTVRLMVERRIQRSNSWAKPNAPSVAARKRNGGAVRGPTPLIETGLLLRSIAHKVEIVGGGS